MPQERSGPTHAEVIKKFDEHFLQCVNVTFERHLFIHRDQLPGETLDRYLNALRTLARTCEFGQLKDSSVRDRFICGVSVKEKLMATKGVTLEMAFDRCRMAQAAMEQVRVIERSCTGD